MSEDGQFNEKWADAAIKAACAAAFEAMKKAEPVRIYVNRGSAPLMTKNRRADETVADSDLVVLKAAGLDGNIKGMIISYACHCTVLDANNDLVSADYPGYLYKIYKERYPDCVTIFYNGAAGNLNIGYSSDASALGIDMGDIRTYENAAQKAAYLSGCIDKLLESACELAVKASFKRIELRIPIKDDLPAAEELERVITEYEIKLKKSKSPEEKRYYELKHIYNTCLYRRVRDFIIADRKYIRAESIIYSIGGVIFITIPGELFCQIGMMIKDLYRDCFIPVIVGYANGYYGYLPTKAALEAGGYESETSIISKAAEKYLVDEMRLAKVSILESLNFTE